MCSVHTCSSNAVGENMHHKYIVSTKGFTCYGEIIVNQLYFVDVVQCCLCLWLKTDIPVCEVPKTDF